MIKLNAFAISGLLITITYLPLFVLIIRNSKTRIARIYSLHILSVFLWGLGSFFIGINSDPAFAKTLWKLSLAPVFFISGCFLHTTLILLNKNKKIYIYPLYAIGFYFSLASLTGKFFNNVYLFSNSFYYHIGNKIYFTFFIVWIFTVTLGHSLLIIYYKKCYPEQKKQTLALMFSSIGFAGGILNFLPALEISIYPYGNFFIIIPSFIITYAILRHQLMDVKVIFKKSIIYSILIAATSLFYLVAVIFIEKILQKTLGYHSISLSIIIAFGLGLIFVPLRNKIQIFVDKLLFKNTREEITQENELLKQEITQTEKLRSVATLASGMAHEIKNPLTAIKTFCEYLPQKLEDKEFLNKFSRIVGNEINYIDNIVHRLLEFAKPSPLTLENIDIHNLINNILDFLNNDFIKYKIKITRKFNSSNSQILIEADTNQLKQAFLNIFLNAIDAMKTGGNLSVKTEINTNILNINIKDSGSGISKKELKHIFDPFYTKKDGGTGLGLSITQRIILNHKGIISTKSHIGQGTTFLIQLPASEQTHLQQLD